MRGEESLQFEKRERCHDAGIEYQAHEKEQIPPFIQDGLRSLRDCIHGDLCHFWFPRFFSFLWSGQDLPENFVAMVSLSVLSSPEHRKKNY